MSNIATKRGVTVKKVLFISVIVVMMSMLLFSLSASAEQIYYNDEYHYYDGGVIKLKVNGKPIENLPMYPVIINDYTMVPVREVFEALGSQVLWHDDTCQVEVIDNGVSVLVKIGDRNTYIDGVLVPISEPQPLPMLIGQSPAGLKSMVPVRFIAEKLGYEVDWDGETRTVFLNRNGNENDDAIGDIDYDDVVIPNEEGIFGSPYAVANGMYDYIYIPSKVAASPVVTRYSNPDRVVLDFSNAKFDHVGGSVIVSGNCVEQVRYSNHITGVARVVLDVKSKTQVSVFPDKNGTLIRATSSVNEAVMYDAVAGRVYFDKTYAGTGKKVTNGYSVTFTNLKLENQTISVGDGFIDLITIVNTQAGCVVTVTGNENIVYTAEKGFYGSNSPIVEETPSFGNGEGKIVVIDAGHGGSDPGALGRNSSGSIVARESEINLAIALLVGEKLKNSGVKVIYTRDSDVYVKLKDRAEISNNAECDMFVSIHCNSIENSAIKGTQVYYHPVSELGTKLAKNIYNKVLENTPLDPKGTQNGSHLYVIRTTTSPAVLVETAFISNESDRNYLLHPSGQEALAEAIYQGIMTTME